MSSPYLDRPLLRLDVVLPKLLENIEAELGNERLEAGDVRRLYQRAELIRSLLAPGDHLRRRDQDRLDAWQQ